MAIYAETACQCEKMRGSVRVTEQEPMSKPTIQLTRSGAVFTGSDEQVDALRRQFQERHFVHLRELLEPELLRHLVQRVQSARFEERTREGIGKELWGSDPGIRGGLGFLLNDPAFLGLVERITQCGEIGCFEGRVYRLVPKEGHLDSWHDDLASGRLVAMSLNLSTQKYVGGVLQIRKRGSADVLAEVENQGLGDAVLFQLRSDLEHRVTNLRGSAPRTAFAGWFYPEPSSFDILKEAASKAAAAR